MRNNRLSDLPAELAGCRGLRELVLSFNAFAAIPACVFALSQLDALLLNDNKVAGLDTSGLQRLAKLACLDLSNNNIGSIPPELGALVVKIGSAAHFFYSCCFILCCTRSM